MPKQIKKPGADTCKKQKQVELTHSPRKGVQQSKNLIGDKPTLKTTMLRNIGKNKLRKEKRYRKSLTTEQQLDRLPIIPTNDPSEDYEDIKFMLDKLPPLVVDIPTVNSEKNGNRPLRKRKEEFIRKLEKPYKVKFDEMIKADINLKDLNKITDEQCVDIKTYVPKTHKNYAEIDPAIISVGIKPTIIVENAGAMKKFFAKLGLYELARIDLNETTNHLTYSADALDGIRDTIDKFNPIDIDNKLYNFLKLHKHSSYENRNVKLEHFTNLAKRYINITSSSVTLTTIQSSIMLHTISRAVDDCVDEILKQPLKHRVRNGFLNIFRNFFSPQRRLKNRQITMLLQ